MSGNGDIVGYQQERETKLRLELFQEVEYLRLYGHVERTRGLVEDHELGVERQRPGDTDTLALPPRELVRIAVELVTRQTDTFEQLSDPLCAQLFVGATDRHRYLDLVTGVD